jgi:hypothetical protein
MEAIMPFTSEQELAGAVNNILDGLGDSSEKVAASLRGKGIKGRRCTAEQCPIARLLKSEIEGATWASVSSFCNATCVGSVSCRIRNPEPVADFVTSFDCGDYRDLEAD